MRITFAVVSLNVGGGEVMLVRVCRELIKRGHQVHVAAILEPEVDSIHRELLGCGVSVEILISGGLLNSAGNFLIYLSSVLIGENDIYQGWMYHGNLLVSILGCLGGGGAPIFWSLHNFDFSRLRWRTKVLVRISGLFSSFEYRVYSCSKAAIPIHLACGFSRANISFLPNGLDALIARPSIGIRSRLGLCAEAIVVGWVGRDHPDKNFDFFASAIREIINLNRDIHFICIGAGITEADLIARGAINDSDMSTGFIHLLGPVSNAVAFMAEFNILAMSSATEAFPLVLIEAMSCGVSAVVTNVGDCPDIVDGLGVVVPVGDSCALAMAILEQISRAQSDVSLAAKCRDRVLTRYTLSSMVDHMTNDYLGAIVAAEGVVV